MSQPVLPVARLSPQLLSGRRLQSSGSGQYPCFTCSLMKSSSHLLSAAKQIRSTTIEVPNIRTSVPVFGSQKTNTIPAIAAIPLTIIIAIRLRALMRVGLPSGISEPAGISDTGVRSAAPHFLQKMIPVPAGAPQREQVALLPPLGSMGGHHTLTEDS